MSKKISVIAVTYFTFFKQCLPLRNQVQCCFSDTDVLSLRKIMENVVKKKVPHFTQSGRKGKAMPKSISEFLLIINVTRIPWLPCYTNARKIKWKCYGITSTEQPNSYNLREIIKHSSMLNKNCSVLRKECIDITAGVNRHC